MNVLFPHGFLLLAYCLRAASSECSPLPCQRGLGYPGNDLHPPPGLPNPYPDAGLQGCALACYQEPLCLGFTAIDQGVGACAAIGGCCLLKSRAVTAEAVEVAGHCSAILRADPQVLPPPSPPSPPPLNARSVLHIIIDDLRPQLSPWVDGGMQTPNIAALAATGTTFTRAYAAIAVCSPSRMSFLTGRLPSRTRTWNFMNSIRQATCNDLPGTIFLDATYAFLNASKDWGGSGQCCTFCQADPACAAWVYKEGEGTCHLKNTATQPAPAAPGTVSGLRGSLATRAWTTLPQNFLNHGYSSVVGAGKIFHADNGGAGPPPFDGSGQPPLQDPLSWSRHPNATMGSVNAVACTWPCQGPACGVNASAQGVPAPGVPPLSDKVTGDDGLAKLRSALGAGPSRPFYVAVGFRKPHLPFRAPAHYQALYPPLGDIPPPRYPTLDASVPPIAYHASGLWGDPYHAMPQDEAARYRRDYWAATSWVDHQVGVLLGELEAWGRANDTLVVLHSDHGYSLGEGGSWEKFTNFEYGARVPLIIRAPWLPPSVGRTTSALVELCDLFPTMAELAGVPLPPGETLDGASLVPTMVSPPPPPGGAAAAPVGPRPTALSVYPRCPADTRNISLMYAANDCCTVERSAFFAMGVSIRTDTWRYTEWPLWNGTALEPQWAHPLVGAELYNHSGDDGRSFDGAFEVINLANDPAFADIRAQLSIQLRAAYNRGA